MYKVFRHDSHPARITNPPSLVAETDDIEEAADICRIESRRGPHLTSTVLFPDNQHWRPYSTNPDGSTYWVSWK